MIVALLIQLEAITHLPKKLSAPGGGKINYTYLDNAYKNEYYFIYRVD
jgi:hypothetical protein